MAKISFLTIKANNTLSAINENFNRIKQEMQDKLFYRNNTSGETNTLTNDVDVNGNDIFNVANVSTDTLTIGGVLVEPMEEVLGGGYVKSYNGRQGDVLSIPSDKTGLALTKSDVGLSNVDNTSDAGKPISSATQTALDLKAPIASPTFTGTVNGVTKAMVGLGNVDNTSDANKPVSTAQATAIGLKANTASPSLTGNPQSVTPAFGNNTTSIATTAFVQAALTTNAAYVSAHNNSVDQVVAPGSAVKVNFSTEVYDVGAKFATSAWTPPAGPILIEAQGMWVTTTVSIETTAIIFKNGVEFKRGSHETTSPTTTGAKAVRVSCMDVANGTDVYDLRVQHNSAGNLTLTGAPSITYFQGTTLKP